jgi:murein DD-endopeptidase MepM/ murein hydrolase activator NlpD
MPIPGNVIRGRFCLGRRKLVVGSIAVLVSATLVIGGLVAAASADTALKRALHQRALIVKRIERLRDLRKIARHNLDRQIRRIERRLRHLDAHGPTLASDRNRFSKAQLYLLQTREHLRDRLRKMLRSVRRQRLALQAQHLQLTSWIQTYGVLRRCPVDGPHGVTNNFGVWVVIPGVPPHIHQGNDIMAATGTPIVAPFDGTAVATPNPLGGQAVIVYGDQGFVYNAHLSAYGHLGVVKTGEIVGYVGSTGDAGAPHDHFEWHPGNGAAVDPYPFLMAVC